ncbi:MAG: serine hydroxymethyltransferase [Acholeplasmataceae bacterium]|jgi:glycine hydroxymethyltransferase
MVKDQIIFDLIKKEAQRQEDHIELIASENFVSNDVLQAQGSILTNKYAEGYPNARYYGGCEVVDLIESEAQNRLKKLFNCNFANVQPHSGSQANASVYLALLKPGDKILGMDLNAGGHLTHGYKVSSSGHYYVGATYSVNPETELIDYDEVLKIAKREKPQLIVAGASSYSRVIDFQEFRKIADEVGAYLLVDMAHIAGLVATGLHPSPIPYADVVTSTTHKTLRGPRGGIILSNNPEIAKKINKAVFPGHQGGPLMHVIAGKAVAFGEALKPEFKAYQQKVLKNAKTLADEFLKLGYKVVSGGTDNHLLTVDVFKTLNITGLEAETLLESVNITCNKNGVPFDPSRPKYTSGIRLGTPAMTTRGLKEVEMVLIARLIDRALKNRNNKEELLKVKQEVLQLLKKYPLYEKR